ncbi:ATP-dependent DNA helicase [Trichonephila clavata]|uniref:ATP-dependent DNA helicase n=1 Tax=Trichonephila clavata TaxID=2740835 RepID=A0A8X6IZK3_TRICU|nr:ATP-dependent DNA helicase [Trichonephila clavata]
MTKDKCIITHKHSLKALQRTLQDLNGNESIFVVAVVLLSGDFRQTLRVIPYSTFAHEINACLKQLCLWRNVETLQLTINTRVHLQDDQSE